MIRVLFRLLGIGLLWYAILAPDYYFLIWAMLAWEIGSGFRASTVLWLSNIGR